MALPPLILRSVEPAIVNYNEQELNLSLQLSKTAIRYVLTHWKNNQILALAEYSIGDSTLEEAMANLMKNESLWQFNYRNVLLMCEPSKSTLVPDVLYNSEYKEDYLQLSTTPLTQTEWLFTEENKQMHLQVVSTIPSYFCEIVKKTFARGIFLSRYAVLLDALSVYVADAKKERYKVFIHLNEQSFDLFVFEKHDLTFVNTFAFKDVAELVYFFLYALNSLHIDLGDVRLKVCGKSNHQKEILTALDPHVFSIHPLLPPSDRKIPKGIHYADCFTLINMPLCVL